nr:hypothetical protein [Streptomyces microflavus]
MVRDVLQVVVDDLPLFKGQVHEMRVVDDHEFDADHAHLLQDEPGDVALGRAGPVSLAEVLRERDGEVLGRGLRGDVDVHDRGVVDQMVVNYVLVTEAFGVGAPQFMLEVVRERLDQR